MTGSLHDDDTPPSLLGMRGSGDGGGKGAASMGGMNAIDGTGRMMEDRRRGHKYSDDGSGRDVDHRMMDVDGESGTAGMDTSEASVGGVTSGCGGTSGVRTEDDSQSDDDMPIMGGGRRVKTIDSHPVAFALPHDENSYICTMGMDDIPQGDGPQSQQSQQQPNVFTSPQVVDSIIRFNPPRPPESVEPKKIHRLHRWETNPQDVEEDLINYLKNVEQTCEELHKTEDEINE